MFKAYSYFFGVFPCKNSFFQIEGKTGFCDFIRPVFFVFFYINIVLCLLYLSLGYNQLSASYNRIMIKGPVAPLPEDEDERLKALYKLDVLDTLAEERFDRITQATLRRFDVIISTISLIDRDREWFKSCSGTYIGAQGPRDISFCGHALSEKAMLIVEDTKKDPRFANNPYVIGPPFIRFYAGVVLHERSTNQPVGVFCIKGKKPRQFNEQDIADLLDLAKNAEDELNSKLTKDKK